MKWINFYLNQNDRVIYITDEDIQNTYSKKYSEFVDFVNPFCHGSNFEIIENLNKYRTIMLDCSTGKFIIYQRPTDIETSFQDLLSLNLDEDEKEIELEVKTENIDNSLLNLLSTKVKQYDIRNKYSRDNRKSIRNNR